MATADQWRAWTHEILSGEEPASTRATRALCDAARRDGRRAMPGGGRVDEATVEDLVQEVLAVSFQQVLEADSPKALFMVAVRRRAIDRHRRERRETSLDALPLALRAGSTTSRHEARAEVRAVVAFLEASLSSRDLRVFEAHAVLGLSSKEVGEQQGLSASNVDQIVSRVRRRLEEHLCAST